MDHRVGYLYSGREAIEYKPANFAFENRNEIGKIAKIFRGAMNRRGKVAFQRTGDFEYLISIRMTYQQRGWTKYLGIQI